MENDVVLQQEEEECACPPQTVCDDGDLLCVNIPCCSTVVLLGIIQLNLGPICLRVGSTGALENATDEEKLAQVQQVFGALKNSLPNFTA